MALLAAQKKRDRAKRQLLRHVDEHGC
jgi:hypothetical protein